MAMQSFNYFIMLPIKHLRHFLSQCVSSITIAIAKNFTKLLNELPLNMKMKLKMMNFEGRL